MHQSKRAQNGNIEAERLAWLVNKFNTLLSQQNQGIYFNIDQRQY